MKKLLAMALLVCVCLSIVACGIAKDPADLKKKMEDKDYEVMMSEKETEVKGYLTMLGLPTDGATAIITAFNDDEEGIVVIYYEDAKAAGEAYDKLQENWDDLMEELDEEDRADYKCGKSGTAIYYGTKDGIKDAK